MINDIAEIWEEVVSLQNWLLSFMSCHNDLFLTHCRCYAATIIYINFHKYPITTFVTRQKKYVMWTYFYTYRTTHHDASLEQIKMTRYNSYRVEYSCSHSGFLQLLTIFWSFNDLGRPSTSQNEYCVPISFSTKWNRFPVLPDLT